MSVSDQGSRRILVTGGAGFIGGSLSVELAARGHTVTAVDNLRRRGAELNLPRLREAGVTFCHADVREPSDLTSLDTHEVLVECSAEPSVLAGFSDTRYTVETNLMGAYNCLELARRDGAHLIFLSTSRVYPFERLRDVALVEAASRFEIAPKQSLPGISPSGVSEAFPLDGARTLYGATKLAAELLVAEYQNACGLRTTINRCGVIAGPWQMGKIDQGVFTHWLLSHYFKRPLSYIGFGGQGKQVRDLLHVDDLVQLILIQVAEPDRWNGCTFNVGGGSAISLSLRETTAVCEDLTGNRLAIRSDPDTRPGDVPVYVSDCAAIGEFSEWRPARSARDVLVDIFAWISEHEATLKDRVG